MYTHITNKKFESSKILERDTRRKNKLIILFNSNC